MIFRYEDPDAQAWWDARIAYTRAKAAAQRDAGLTLDDALQWRHLHAADTIDVPPSAWLIAEQCIDDGWDWTQICYFTGWSREQQIADERKESAEEIGKRDKTIENGLAAEKHKDNKIEQLETEIEQLKGLLRATQKELAEARSRGVSRRMRRTDDD